MNEAGNQRQNRRSNAEGSPAWLAPKIALALVVVLVINFFSAERNCCNCTKGAIDGIPELLTIKSFSSGRLQIALGVRSVALIRLTNRSDLDS